MNDQSKIGFLRWLKGFMLQHMYGMITCRQFEEFVQAYQDDELPARQKRVFELHLRICRECREYLAAYQRSIELGQKVFESPDASLPSEVPEDLVKAILESRKE